MGFFKAKELPPQQLAFLGGQTTESIIADDDSIDLIDKPPPLPVGSGVSLRTMLAAVVARQGLAESFGTAFRIGPRTWLTAGHVLQHFDNGFAATGVELFPGYALTGLNNGLAVRAEIHPDWTAMADIGSDLAILTLAAVPPGPPQFFRLAADSTAALKGAIVNVLGYRSNGHMFTDLVWQVTRLGDPIRIDRLFHQGDTTPGESGGPLIAWPPLSTGTANLSVVGIHSRGVNDPASTKPNHNTATRISEDLLAWIVERIV